MNIQLVNNKLLITEQKTVVTEYTKEQAYKVRDHYVQILAINQLKLDEINAIIAEGDAKGWE